ncbi:MAG TPA: hypothetical protein VIC87_08590, partial [Vicinamibacteria bacterium]
MMGSQVDWFPALAFLAAGIAFGAVVVFWLRRARAAPVLTTAPLEVRDLLGRRDVLLRQLRELEDTASKRNPEQLARERYSLEIETAGVLRELDRRPGARAAAPAGAVEAAGATATGLLAGRPALRGFLWGVGGAGAVALLLFLVSQASRPRSEGAPATGDVPGARGAQAADAPAADGLDELRAAIARDPGDIDARMALVRAHLGRQDMMGVW